MRKIVTGLATNLLLALFLTAPSVSPFQDSVGFSDELHTSPAVTYSSELEFDVKKSSKSVRRVDGFQKLFYHHARLNVLADAPDIIISPLANLSSVRILS